MAVVQTAKATACEAGDPLAELRQKQQYIITRVTGVVHGYYPGLYLHGRPGTGKTHTVLETLKGTGTKYHYHRGHITPVGLFDLLEENDGRIIVLDDVSSIFKQPIALQILLAALERKEVGVSRLIRYKRSGKEGDRVIPFTGGIIAISNLALGHDPVLDALKDRVQDLPYEPSEEEMEALIRSLAANGWSSDGAVVTPKECLEVAELVIAESRRIGCRIDIRLYMDKALADYLQHREGYATIAWQDLVKTTLQGRMQDSPNEFANSFPNKKMEMKAHSALALRLSNEIADKGEQIKRWQAQTGMSAHTFERRLSEARRQKKAKIAK
jgi:hypothetical protein